MFFEKVLEYFQTHLIETAIIGGIALVMLIAIIALIVTGAKAKKRKPIVAAIQESPAIESAPVEKPTPAATEEKSSVGAIQESPAVEPAVEPAQPSEPTPAQEETAAAADTAASTTTEEQPSVGAIQESTAPTPAPAKPAQPKKEKSPKAAKSALAATKKMGNETKEQPATTPAQSSEPAPVKPAKPTQPKKEKAATEPTKRYTGKWVVCKLILTDDNDQATEERYFFELRASNGERLLTSEEYLSYQGALKGIQTHKDNAEKGNFRITVSKKGDYIFKLLTAKNTLLCTGANYKSLERCESADSANRDG